MGDPTVSPLLWLIGAAEVAFWGFLLAGLATRYLLRRRRLGGIVLLGVPLVDVVLVTAAAGDVLTGGEPASVHGLAALYLGVTVAFGHSLVRWADVRFAHRFAGGPTPVKPPRGGLARTRHEWREFGKVVATWVITAAVLVLLTVLAGRGIPAPGDWTGDPMWSWLSRASLVAGIWFVVGPLWATVFPGTDEFPGTGDRERSGV
ncbi:hypothetical protein [Pseudonocardia phyllosphaerae]|uniref:hypothetical protein n=1 Tax=Pseudonocardia phyllosphaerae TaxID=3390502 RepID=UPI00397D0E6B